MSVFSELKRRNVFRVAAAYLVAGWLLIEVSETLEGTLHLPEWSDTLLAYFVILGFPVALFFSWAYEITPEGIKREKDIGPGDAPRSQTARRLDWTVIILLILAAGFFALDRFVWEKDESQQVATPPEVVLEETYSAESATSDSAPVSIAPALSIAVLPFVNLSSDPEQEYFSDGLTEELLNLLAGVEQLKVAARTSSFYYKDKLELVPLAEIARALDVAHVLEGSVRKGGDRIRITAQLIKADDGFHLWSQTWDRTLEDIFAIQDEIAAAVTEELKITLLGEAPVATVVDTDSYELTLQGRFLFSRRAEGDMERAFELFQQAVAIDPDNAAAWVGLAPLYFWLFDPPRLEDALEATGRAVNLDPANPEAWSRRAMALWTAGDEEGGNAAWDQAVALGENNALLQSQIAGELISMGDLKGGIEAQKRAVALDPLHVINLGNLSSYYLQDGQLDQAQVHAEKILTLAPNGSQGLERMAEIQLLRGRPAEAKEFIERYLPEGSGATVSARNRFWFDALIEHSLGNREAADAALQQFIEEYGETRPVSLACIYAWRGDHDAAFALLNRALDEHPDLSVQWSWEPWLAALRDDPRWDELMLRWTGTVFVNDI